MSPDITEEDILVAQSAWRTVMRGTPWVRLLDAVPVDGL